jgi:hypothetical protein
VIAFNNDLRVKNLRARIAAQGTDAAICASPEAFEAEFKAQAPAWERVVRDSGVRVEQRERLLKVELIFIETRASLGYPGNRYAVFGKFTYRDMPQACRRDAACCACPPERTAPR